MTALSHQYNHYGLAEYHKQELCYPYTDRPAFLFWEPPLIGPWQEHLSSLHAWHDGRCGLCGFISGLVMDHDHRTGLERGLLCRSCNTREGVSDDPRIDPWRGVLNTANHLGPPQQYVSAFGTTPMRREYVPSDEELDRIAEMLT